VQSGGRSRRPRNLWPWVILPVAAFAALPGGIVAGAKPALILVPVLLVVPVIVWKRTEWAVLFLLATALVIEDFEYDVGTHTGAFTDKIPWWRTFTHGATVFPAELLMGLIILVWILKASQARSWGLPKSPVRRALAAYSVLLAIAVGVGLMHHAQLKYDLWEVRSWLYLIVAYLLAAAFLRTRQALDALLWTIVLGSGFKAVQGTYIFFDYARAMRPRPEAILGHEESFFFGVFVTLTVALWLYQVRGKLRTTATCLLPLVLIADLANARRTAWLVIAVSMAVLFATTWVTMPARRRFLGRLLFVFLVGSAVYLPLYWNHQGTLAQPARATRSQFDPSQRDESSDVYRQTEDVNLRLSIQSAGPLGTGFGIPIDYVVPIANITSFDPMIDYIPHNGLLWIWLRVGIQGEIAFWCLIAVCIVRACRLSKVPDPRLAMIGALVAASIVGYLSIGYEDMGFSFFRIAVAMGCLLGAMEAAIRLSPSEDLAVPPDDDARYLPNLSTSSIPQPRLESLGRAGISH
jgi:hypothetical protein